MTAAIIVLLILAAFAAVLREFVWMDRVKEIGWRHNDRVRSLEAENEELEAAGRAAVTAVKQARLEVVQARGYVEAASG